MAWVRTALSMISFGFTIYKFLQVVDEQSGVPVLRPNAPRNVGLVLTGLGTFVVVVASIQHWSYVKKLKNRQALQAMGPEFHRGVPHSDFGRLDVRKHRLSLRSIRLISSVRASLPRFGHAV